jgi:hypothetical protein
LISFIESLQLIYSAENSQNLVKDSDKLLSSVQAAGILIKKNGGKIVVFNSSASWGVKFKGKGNMSRDQLIYSSMDDGSITSLGKSLTVDLISCDIFQFQTSKENQVTLINIL